MERRRGFFYCALVGLAIIYFVSVPFESTLNRVFGSSIKYILFALLFVYLLYILSNKRKIRINDYCLSEFFWCLLVCVSLIWTSYHVTDSLVFTYGTMVLMLVVFSDRKIFDERAYEKIITAYMVGSATLAIILIRYGATGKSYSLSGRLTINIMGIEGGDENQLAAVISPAIVIAFSRLLKQTKIPQKVVYGVIVIVSIFAQLLTGSRGGLIASFVAMVVVFFMNKRKLSIGNIISTSLIAIVFFTVVLGKLPDVLSQRLFGFSTYAGGSGRSDIWRVAVQAFSERPILGYGLNGWYNYAIQNYGKLIGTHNTYLKVLLDVGLIGFSLFIFPFYKAMKFNLRNRNTLETGILISALVASFFIDVLQVRFLWNALYITMLFQASRNNT